MTAVLRCFCERCGDVIFLRVVDYLDAHRFPAEPIPAEPFQLLDPEVPPLSPAKKTAAQPAPRPRLRLAERDGVLAAIYPLFQYRFLFDDGATLDVIAYRDDSDLREAMLEAASADRIAGVATVLSGMTPP